MTRLRNWFHVGGDDVPGEYTDYLLCTQVYRCTPSELDEQDANTVLLHLEMFNEDRKREKKRGATLGD